MQILYIFIYDIRHNKHFFTIIIMIIMTMIRYCRRIDPLPSPQPESPQHLPMRHGQAGHRHHRAEPVRAHRHPAVHHGLSAEADGEDADAGFDQFRPSARRTKCIALCYELFRYLCDCTYMYLLRMNVVMT